MDKLTFKECGPRNIEGCGIKEELSDIEHPSFLISELFPRKGSMWENEAVLVTLAWSIDSDILYPIYSLYSYYPFYMMMMLL